MRVGHGAQRLLRCGGLSRPNHVSDAVDGVLVLASEFWGVFANVAFPLAVQISYSVGLQGGGLRAVRVWR